MCYTFLVTPTPSSAVRQIARAAGTVMVAMIVSNLVGLLRWILVTRAFGTLPEIEAFNPANRVSETLFNLVAGGALASAFIPNFTGLLAQNDRRGAWRLASAIVNVALVVLILAACLAAVLAPQIVRHILVPGFADEPGKEALTVSLLRLMLPSAVLFGISGLMMGILNSHQIFLIPALAPAMYSLGMIFGTLALSPRLGIWGLAWGVNLGAALHLGLQIPALLRLKGQYYPNLGLKDASAHEVLRLLGPRLLGVAVVQLNFWVNSRIASFQPEGSVSAITYAFTLMLMPQAAIAQSIAIASMPTFCAQYALGQLSEMRASLATIMRGVLLLSLPASLGLALLRTPLVAALFQRGNFDQRSTELVTWALLWYAAGLVGHSLVEVLSRAFYSLHDTKTPVLIGAVAMGLNVLFSFVFSAWFVRLGWLPHGGLALANSLATSLEAAGLIALMHRRLGGLDGRYILSGAGGAVLASLAMSLALWAWLSLAGEQPAWLLVAGGLVLGGAVYALAVWLVRLPEARGVVGIVVRRGRAALSR
jgi:putative peptidoglycan lipid II flippase